MSIGLALAVVLFLGLLPVLVVAARLLRRKRMQFSLRTLLLVVGLVALLLSAWFSYDRWTTARLAWLPPSSAAAIQLRAAPTIREEEGLFKATVRPRYRDVGELISVVRRTSAPAGGSFGSSQRQDEQQAELEASDRPLLEERLAAIAEADVPVPGCHVIHGIVEDSQGRAVRGAMVDLLGPYVYINHFTTRPDGTFTMPVRAPAGSGYYLRVRYGDGRRMETQTFSLDDGSNELYVRVTVRQATGPDT